MRPGKARKSLGGLGEAAFHRLLAGRLGPPERFADEHQATRAQAAFKQANGSGDTATDPGRPDAGGDVHGTVGYIGRSVAMHERDLSGDVEGGGAFASGG